MAHDSWHMKVTVKLLAKENSSAGDLKILNSEKNSQGDVWIVVLEIKILLRAIISSFTIIKWVSGIFLWMRNPKISLRVIIIQ